VADYRKIYGKFSLLLSAGNCLPQVYVVIRSVLPATFEGDNSTFGQNGFSCLTQNVSLVSEKEYFFI